MNPAYCQHGVKTCAACEELIALGIQADKDQIEKLTKRNAILERQNKRLREAGDNAWGRDDLMAIAAVRYCLGRSSYIVSDCADWLVQAWQSIPERAQATIRRDVEDAFVRDDEDRANGEQHKALGWDCDRQQWDRVRKLWGVPK